MVSVLISSMISDSSRAWLFLSRGLLGHGLASSKIYIPLKSSSHIISAWVVGSGEAITFCSLTRYAGKALSSGHSIVMATGRCSSRIGDVENFALKDAFLHVGQLDDLFWPR